MLQKLTLCVSEIPREKIYTSPKTGKKYLAVILLENRDGKDQYDNDGGCKLDQSKEERQSGQKAPFVGNWRYIGQSQKPAPERQDARQRPQPALRTVDPDLDDDEVPF